MCVANCMGVGASGAGHGDGAAFPWVEADVAWDANIDGKPVGSWPHDEPASTVGIYAEGTSEEGVMDLSGTCGVGV